MPNENHETYGGINISTYTDDITTQNRFTEEDIMACVLSAGVTPNTDTCAVQTGSFSHESATGGPNDVSPFYKESNSNILWYDDSGLALLPTSSLYRYKHCVFVSTSGNKLASSLKIDNYRIFLSIREVTDTDIRGKTIKWYIPEPTLKYGAEDDWTVSALQPAFLYKNTNDIVGAQSVAALITQCNWYWGGANNVQNFLNGWNMFDRNLQYGTDMGGHEYVPWEKPGTDPIRIKEGGSDATFPCYFENDHFLWAFYGNNPLRLFCGYNNIEDILLITAFCGLKFVYNNVLYKPLVSGGIVTGYTSDMDRTSEWDEWHDIGDHEIPYLPPSPTPPVPVGDDIDDHRMGAGGSINGMANLWLLTKAQLTSLHNACNSAPAGYDPLTSFISVMALGVIPTRLMHEIQYITPINIRRTNGESWQTGVEGHIVDNSTLVPSFNFPGIYVQRKYNSFLDYSPYAVHEIFLPCCGWLTLPDMCVDRAITVTYIPDINTLKCRAVVSVVDNSGRRCVIGEKDGIMGADIPFTNTGHSLYLGDAIVNSADVAGEIITGAIGAGFTKTNAKGGTYRPYEGFTVGMGGTLPGAIGNAFVSGNVNKTHYAGGNGCSIGFSDGENIQIKSTYHAVDIPSNYAHTVGLMCNKTGKLENFSGFTICENPHITFSALEDEKAEIKRLLEEGVIL